MSCSIVNERWNTLDGDQCRVDLVTGYIVDFGYIRSEVALCAFSRRRWADAIFPDHMSMF